MSSAVASGAAASAAATSATSVSTSPPPPPPKIGPFCMVSFSLLTVYILYLFARYRVCPQAREGYAALVAARSPPPPPPMLSYSWFLQWGSGRAAPPPAPLQRVWFRDAAMEYCRAEEEWSLLAVTAVLAAAFAMNQAAELLVEYLTGKKCSAPEPQTPTREEVDEEHDLNWSGSGLTTAHSHISAAVHNLETEAIAGLLPDPAWVVRAEELRRESILDSESYYRDRLAQVK